MPRSAVAIYLPEDEFPAVSEELADAGYEAIAVSTAGELEALLESRSDVGLAILDGESDFDTTIEMYSLLHDGERNVASLMIVSSTAVDRLSLAGRARINGEFVNRPYSAASLRWRVEAMLIRAETMLIRSEALGDSTRGALLAGDVGVSSSVIGHRGQIIVIFNPKGGVGKTTIAINTSAVLQMRKNQRVLLINCDTVTGHVLTSLGMAEIPTVVDVWGADLGTNASHSLAEIASAHSSGVKVLTMSRSPLHTEVLRRKRVAQAISAARDAFDWIIVDMHPDYGPLNQGIFTMADQILVPVTPEFRPFVRRCNSARSRSRHSRPPGPGGQRSNSGVSASDVEKVVGFGAIARIRSAGMLFVLAANSHRWRSKRSQGEGGRRHRGPGGQADRNEGPSGQDRALPAMVRAPCPRPAGQADLAVRRSVQRAGSHALRPPPAETAIGPPRQRRRPGDSAAAALRFGRKLSLAVNMSAYCALTAVACPRSTSSSLAISSRVALSMAVIAPSAAATWKQAGAVRVARRGSNPRGTRASPDSRSSRRRSAPGAWPSPRPGRPGIDRARIRRARSRWPASRRP